VTPPPEPALRRTLQIALVVLLVGVAAAGAWSAAVTRSHDAAASASARATAAAAVAPRSTPVPVPPVSDDRMRVLIDEVVGTGSLRGAVTGDFTITHEYGSPVLHLRHLEVGSSPARDLLVAVDLESATCRANHVGTIAGRITTRRTQRVLLQDSSPQIFSDLSYMRALAVWDLSCTPSEIGAGPIRWSLPKALRDLGHADLGARPGARGVVERRGGRPVGYVVASGDALGAVAARFGLTPWELLYLNPLRDRGSNDSLFAEERLSLDPLHPH
jgi:hypothetical protein